MDIIPMEARHLNAVLEIEIQSFTLPWSRQSYTEELTKTGAFYFVALENSRVIGYIGMWHVVNEAHITTFAVSPEKRKCGAGTALLNHLVETAAHLGTIGMMLEVRINNYDAQRLYFRKGFILERIRKNYYSDTNEDALVLWKDFA